MKIFLVGKITVPAIMWLLLTVVASLTMKSCNGFRTTTFTVPLLTKATTRIVSPPHHHHAIRRMMTRSSSDHNDEEKDDDNDLPQTAHELKQFRERALFGPLVDDLFCTSRHRHNNNNIRPLVDVALAGRGTVGAWGQPKRSLGSQALLGDQKAKPILCVFLSTPEASDEMIAHYLQQRYPTWEIPPDLQKALKTIATGASCPPPGIPAIPLPLPLTLETSKELKLLSFAFRGRPISKSVFLPLAHLLTDRDGASLWNNLPWTEWTIDPQHNVPTHYSQTQSGKKYLLGRRDAYNRMIGKDWYGRSLSPGNLAARAKYKIEGDDEVDDDDTKKQQSKKPQLVNMESDLAFRILQVQVQEATMELAEAEHKYAMIKARFQDDKSNDDFVSDRVLLAHYEEIKASVDEVQRSLKAKKDLEDSLEELKKNALDNKGSETQLEATVNEFLESLVQSRYMGGKDQTSSDGDAAATNSGSFGDAARKFVEGIRKHDNLMDDLSTILDRESTRNQWKNPIIAFLDGVIERETKNAPPYRGAMGYAPQVDTKEEMFTKAVLPYRSPYDLLVEIIQEQFNAQIIGTVLENSSLFPGTLILEGAVVLRRRGRSKIMTIGGEQVQLEDGQDDMGNKGVKMGEILVVECSGAEAIGMSLACPHLPLSVERKVWEEAITDITLSQKVEPLPANQKESVMNTIPPVKQTKNSSNRVTVTEGGEALIGGGGRIQQQQQQEEEEEKSAEQQQIKAVHSLADYDALTIPEKATMILSSGTFEGTLPRPRVMRKFEEDLETYRKQQGRSNPDKHDGNEVATIRTTLSPLDEILVPMLENESVRLQILHRDAKERNDQFAMESIQRTIDELQEEEQQQQQATDLSSISFQQSIDEKLFKEEIENQIWTQEGVVVGDEETEEDQEPSIFE